ncbi:insulinase family protein [Peptoniphilus equinus]|uniref:Insulinase family protein n=1 Tax=Peptoniphilus equinus TaxID=3016343 RepID=A0ABY7QW16_9FIRM|nr:insulinase family protein [Peptoniphilus equinus]WBW50245.1 insulinase family protein [Peptoniphilus equinus]
MYKLIDTKQLDEVASQVSYFIHDKTGAEVLVLKNDDDNKAFGIGFKTVPTDSTGVAHIVEHCVLSGSRKYRTKEPFMDLIKSSQQTFLNAMTFPDKTIYPVSSRNLKDFYNLMDVYLDAVFYPRIYDEPSIFKQEGWHYEYTDGLTINGVVYNEMKGVYSDPQSLIADALTFSLHPNSSYGIDSGGDPKVIADLSYEAFLDFHRRHYHPSNAMIYLYGDLDVDAAMTFIEENYLNHFDTSADPVEILQNEALKATATMDGVYPATDEEALQHNDLMGMGFCVGKSLSAKDLFMRNFLAELLINADAAPIKTAILEQGFAEDVWAETSSSLPLDLSIVVKNTKGKTKDDLEAFVTAELKKLVTDGIDRDLLHATFNKFEFAYREGGGPQKAIIYYIRALNTWNYGESPLEGLQTFAVIDELRDRMDKGYFETYINDKLLNNPYRALVHLTANAEEAARQKAAFQAKMRALEDAMSPEAIAKIKADQQALEHYQTEPDSPEDVATIPTLELEDIQQEITSIPYTVTDTDYGTFQFTEQPTSGITYLNLSFAAKHIPEASIQTMNLLGYLLGKVSTTATNYLALDSKIYKSMGGFGAGIATYYDYARKDGTFDRRFEVSLKALSHQVPEALETTFEVINDTIFSEKTKIKELLILQKSYFEDSLLGSGHQIAASLVKSYYSPMNAYTQAAGGLGYYDYIVNLLDDFESKFTALQAGLEHLKTVLFRGVDVHVSYTADTPKDASTIASYLNALAQDHYEIAPIDFTPEAKNIAIAVPAEVNYVSKGYTLDDLQGYTGSMSVLSNLLSNTYLHTQIRAKGGAYGAGVNFSMQNDVLTYSYRDPHLTQTLEVYDGMGAYVAGLKLDDAALKNFIIASVSAFDPLLDPAGKGSANKTRFLSHLTEEAIAAYKTEALATTLDTLHRMAPAIDHAMAHNYIAAIGSKAMLESSGLFNRIVEIRR